MRFPLFRSMGWGLLFVLAFTSSLQATDTATLTGRVTDETGAVIPGARVEAINVRTDVIYSNTTNEAGVYTIQSLPPGTYRIFVRKAGFRTLIKPDVILRVQDIVAQNFKLAVGSVVESITVEAGVPLLDTQSPAVSTVVDRQFVENLPLNGRSFHTLLELTAGVILTRADGFSPGQFSVNGQRSNANYFTIDGVSANFGSSGVNTLGQEAGGSLPAFSAFGGTSNLVSIDALEEFRIQTSTYAPEFGRTPGGQVSIRTRSGTNEFHGTLFNYFRNDKLDATDWFVNRGGLEQPALRQNDFGGVVGGPMLKDRTFFFVSYEGLRLRQPQTQLTTVPSVSARQLAPPETRPLLDAYPLPNGPDLGANISEFTAAFSNPSSLDAYSLRLDHHWGKWRFFSRYNHAPSDSASRILGFNELPRDFKSQTMTVGATWALAPSILNDFRANWSRNKVTRRDRIIDFQGAIPPPDSAMFPSFTSSQDAHMFVAIFGVPVYQVGKTAANRQRQINLVDSLSVIKGSHQLKFGVDYRRLAPFLGAAPFEAQVVFPDVDFVINRFAAFALVSAQDSNLSFEFNNVSLFVQDTWQATPRLTLTYGLRWEYNPSPSERNDQLPFTVLGLDDPATMTLAPQGTQLWDATRDNFAPRVGVAYHLSERHGVVLRGGFGLFHDLGNGPALVGASAWPYARQSFLFFLPWPWDDATATPPPFSLNPPAIGMHVFDPDLEIPYSAQWNLALEKALGADQTFSVTYVGQVGRRLLGQESLPDLNPDFVQLTVTNNSATSDYHALQAQFQRRLSNGLQALASYTWSHAIDKISSDRIPSPSSLGGVLPNLDADRASSDFDVRHSFTTAVIYNIPSPAAGGAARAVFGNWSVDVLARARSATPLDVTISKLDPLFGSVRVRPDVVPGESFWIDDPLEPEGRRLNPNAFVAPAGVLGSLGRNTLRGFSSWQVDLSARRQFALTDRVNLQFNTDFFNLFNHPNYGDPVSSLPSLVFGKSTQMLATDLGGLNSTYQIGGPRSIQIALKLLF